MQIGKELPDMCAIHLRMVELDGYGELDVISADRMRRYVNACGGNVQKGMTLYRYII